MKATLLSVLMAFTSHLAFSQSTEDESIKKVISAETTAAYNGDMDAWQRTWAHSPKASWTYVSNGSYNTVSGWDSLSVFVGNIIKNSPSSRLIRLSNDNFKISSDGKIAWAEFQQSVTVAGTDSNRTGHSHGYRALIKENNEWKLLAMIAHDHESFTSVTPENIENTLNATGYNLLTAKRLNDAIEVFRLNVKLHPKAYNTYDSLGEALALAGNKKEAIENYEKSIKLNPKHESGIKMLQKLRGK